MVIRLDENYNAMTSTALLGYVGETNARPVSVDGMEIDGADRYVLTIDYGDGTVYEVDITGGTWTPTADILRSAQTVSCQICAKKLSGDEYVLVKKSRIFRLRIGAAIGDTAIPSPDVSMDALDRIDAIGRQAHADMQTAVTAADTATTAAENAKKSATAAGLSADTATQAASRAETAKTAAETSATQAETAMQGAENARQQAVTAQNAAKVSADLASASAQQTTADKTATAGYAQTAKTNADSTAADRQAVADMAEQVTADKAIVADHAAKVAEDRTAAETAAQTAQAVADSLPDDYVTAVGKIAENTAEINNTNTEVSELKEDLANITPDRFYKDNKSNSIDITNLATVNANKYIGGANVVGGTIELYTNSDYKVYELSANNIVGYIKYKRFKPAAIHLCITNESDVILALAKNATLDNWAQNIRKPTWIEVSGVYSTDTETFVEINIDLAKSVLNGGDNIKIWIASTTTDDETVYNILTYHYEYSDFKWLGKVKNENMDNDSVDTAQVKQLSITYEKLNADIRTKLVDYNGSIIMPSLLVLPSGKTIDFHYLNVFRNVNPSKLNYASISRGTKYDGFTRYSLTDSDTDFSATIAGYLASETGVSYSKNIDVKIAKNVASNKKILFIGDSITAQGAYIGKLSEMYSDFTFLGTLLTTGVDNEYSGTPCEGRGGWAAYNYCNNASFSGYTNPFYNGGFDFSYYMQNQGYSDVDVVFINLGTNDPVRGDGTITQMLSCYNQMINSIKSFNSSIKIMLWLPTARAIAYNSLHSELNKALERNEALISEFDNKQNENIILIPVNCCVDPYRDYHFTESVASQYNSDVVKITTDSVHPALSGHMKMADLIYGYINYYA